MPAAFLPSPVRAGWHLGPVPVRAYALCMVAGIIVAAWVANRRYLRIGGRPGLILDLAAWAVPAGLIGGRLYNVVTDSGAYFGAGRDWTAALGVWDGGLGLPGGLAAGAAAGWLAARRAGVSTAPVAGALAPALAFGLAIGSWGNWFSQTLYGRPSALPWAIEIAPAHRVAGYESYPTFQPVFLYASLWDLAVGVLVIWAARRFLLAGDRALAACLAAEAAGRLASQALRVDGAGPALGPQVDQWLMAAVVAGAVGYLCVTRRRRGPDDIASRPPAPDDEAEVGALKGVCAPTRTGQESGGGVICR